MDIVGTQLAELQTRYPAARIEQTPDGQRILVVPGVSIGDGWSRSEVTVRVLVPAGYPHVNPDCFYTEASLVLGSGSEPANSALQVIWNDHYRWFSWHVGGWDAANGSLNQYVRFCERRLRSVQ